MVATRDSNGNFCVVGDTPPDVLGKFLDVEGVLACLETEKVKFTPPNQLNDEWDCIPSGYREEGIRNAWRESPLSQVCPEQEHHFFEEHVNRSWDSFHEMLSNVIGVASFTDLSSCDLPWMWDHYGDHHNGCIIVFDTLRMGTFFKVKYSEKRPEISIPINEETYPPDEVLAVLTTKELGSIDHWEKECEWRMIDHLSHLERNETPKGTIYLKSYPESLLKVICGHSMDGTTFNEITEVAVSKGILVEREKV